jgi:hypothetical protein
MWVSPGDAGDLQKLAPAHLFLGMDCPLFLLVRHPLLRI